MNKLTIASLCGAFLLTACGSTEPEQIAEAQYPVYCIRDVVFLDDKPQGRVLLDMPGYPYGITDKYQEISRDVYNELDVPVCQVDDPRYGLEPSGIAWTDGRNTSLEELP